MATKRTTATKRVMLWYNKNKESPSAGALNSSTSSSNVIVDSVVVCSNLDLSQQVSERSARAAAILTIVYCCLPLS